MVSYAWSSASLADPAPAIPQAPLFPSEGVVTCSGSVCGRRLLPHDVPWRYRAPRSPLLGRVLLVPDIDTHHSELGDLLDALTAEGLGVATLLPAWQGLLGDGRDPFDRGLGLARDVAAAYANLKSISERETLGAPWTLLGLGFGASLGVLAAQVLTRHDALQLDGRVIPSHTQGVLVAPMFAVSSSGTSERWLRRLRGALPWRQQAEADHERAFARADGDIDMVLELSARCDFSNLVVVHALHDPIADSEAATEWAEDVGARVRLVSTRNRRLYSEPSVLPQIASACLPRTEDVASPCLI